MTTPIDRRQFLRGDFQACRSPLRPPWAVMESEFLDRCQGCGQCIDNCPTHILVAGDHNLPEVDFMQGECTFCGQCADTCDTRALNRESYKTLPWSYHAVIDVTACLASQGVMCASCREACLASAIRLPPRNGGAALPVLNANACIGCGACVAPCPAGAIRVRPLPPNPNFRQERTRCT